MVGARRYFHEEGYCCPNNYRRITVELASMIYYQGYEGGEGLGINLYTPSSARLFLPKAGAVLLEQRTEYPGKATYFRLAGLNVAADDELFVNP